MMRNAQQDIVGRKAGIMTVVEAGGLVMKGAKIMVEKPKIYEALPCV